MESTALSPQDRRAAIKAMAERLALIPERISASDIEEQVKNLWYRDEYLTSTRQKL